MACYPKDLHFDGGEPLGGQMGCWMSVFLEERRIRACVDLPRAVCPSRPFSSLPHKLHELQLATFIVLINCFLDNPRCGQ